MAIEKCHTNIVQALLTAGADLSIEYFGSNALIHAACTGHIKILDALLLYLDPTGVNVTTSSADKKTALMFAANFGHTAVVEALIAAGADLNAVDQNGSTALIMAAEGGHTDSVRVLLAAGADFSIRDSYAQRTALMYAADAGHINTVAALLLYLDKMAVNVSCLHGKTAVIFAAEKGHTEIVQILINAGADLRVNHFHNALKSAVSNGHILTAAALIPHYHADELILIMKSRRIDRLKMNNLLLEAIPAQMRKKLRDPLSGFFFRLDRSVPHYEASIVSLKKSIFNMVQGLNHSEKGSSESLPIPLLEIIAEYMRPNWCIKTSITGEATLASKQLQSPEKSARTFLCSPRAITRIKNLLGVTDKEPKTEQGPSKKPRVD
jgi:ankyrin repeat protein